MTSIGLKDLGIINPKIDIRSPIENTLIKNDQKPLSMEEKVNAKSYTKRDNLSINYAGVMSNNAKNGKMICTFVESSENKNLNNNKFKETKLFYVNGIDTNKSDAFKTSETIRDLTNKPVNLIHNPSKGALRDGVEAVHQLLTNSAVNRIDNKTANIFYDTLKSGQGIKVVSHSQGAAITANALNECKKKFMDEGYSLEETSKIMSNCQVITMGGFSSVEDFPKEVKILEVKEIHDLVPAIAENPTNLSPDDFALRKKAIGKSFGGKGIDSKFNALSENLQASAALGVSKVQRTVSTTENAVKEFVIGAVTFISGTNPIDYHSVDGKYLKNYVVKNAIKEFAKSDLSDVDVNKLAKENQNNIKIDQENEAFIKSKRSGSTHIANSISK